MSQGLEKLPHSSVANKDAWSNQQPTDLLVDNAVRSPQPADTAGVIARRHRAKSAFAIAAVIGLMAVAWAYEALFDRDT